MPRLKEYPEPRYNENGKLLCHAHKKGTDELCSHVAKRHYNVCRYHGAGNYGNDPGDANIIHGRRSRFMRERLMDLKEEFLQDEVPEDLTHEVATLRALLSDFLDDVSTATEEELRARHLGSAEIIQAATRLIDSIANAAARMDKMRKDDAVPKSDVLRILTEMRDAAQQVVSDPDEMTELMKRWNGIRLRKVRN